MVVHAACDVGARGGLGPGCGRRHGLAAAAHRIMYFDHVARSVYWTTLLHHVAWPCRLSLQKIKFARGPRGFASALFSDVFRTLRCIGSCGVVPIQTPELGVGSV